jgi:hypothetical protein
MCELFGGRPTILPQEAALPLHSRLNASDQRVGMSQVLGCHAQNSIAHLRQKAHSCIRVRHARVRAQLNGQARFSAEVIDNEGTDVALWDETVSLKRSIREQVSESFARQGRRNGL